MNRERAASPWLAAGVVLAGLLVYGPGGLSLGGATDTVEVGGGTASLEVVEPSGDTIRATRGRFGATVTYVRLPDLVVNVTEVTGQPLLFYEVRVPGFGIERRNRRVLTSTGRVRIPLDDRAVAPETDVDGATARLVVRVDSLNTSGAVVTNRSVTVRGPTAGGGG